MSIPFINALESKEAHIDAIWDIAWTSNDFIVSASADGTVQRWDSTSGQVSAASPRHPLAIVSLSVSPDGQYALYNSLEGTTYLFDLQSGQIVGKHESYDRSISNAEPSRSISLNPKGVTFAGTGGSGDLHISSAEPETFGQHQATLTSGRSKYGMYCAHSPDGKQVALSTEAGQVYIFDLAAGALTATFSSHAMAVRSLAWSADGQLLLTASEDKRLILHDVRASASGKPGSGAVAVLTGHSSWVLSADISPDGRLAVSGSADKTVKVWDLASRAAVSTMQESGEVWGVSWRPTPSAPGSAGAFVSGGESGRVKWWRSAGAGQ